MDFNQWDSFAGGCRGLSVIKMEGRISVRCARCRCVLLADGDIEDHESGGGQSAFKWNKRDKRTGGVADSAEKCSSFFTRCVEWMEEGCEGVNRGKITCPNKKCKQVVGSFNWAGNQCSCGAWIAPAFQIHKSKVDSIATTG